ncbi:MAG: hypothetical protein ACXVBG_22825, partial [Isosphaeraceae bacterium]
PGRASLGFVTPSFREGSLILENNPGVMFRLIREDGKNKKDELSTVPHCTAWSTGSAPAGGSRRCIS